MGHQDDLVCQGSWGLLFLGWVVPKARLYLLCGFSFKSGPTPTHHSPAASGPVTWSLSLLEDKTVERFLESWVEDILGQ